MNKDELKNLVPLAVMVLGPYAAKVGIDASALTQIIIVLGGAALSVYMHWNMRKVHEDAVSAEGDE